MITGNQGRRHQQYAEALGVEDYLTKPFRMERLTECVNGCITKEKTASADDFGI